jgi:hypothetical protein
MLKQLVYTVELHLSELIGRTSYPDVQKIWIIGFSLKIGYIASGKFGCYYLQYAPASKPLNYA